MNEAIITLCVLTGLVYGTPGALPMAADGYARYGRVVSGAGLLCSAAALWQRDFDGMVWGVGLIALGLASVLIAIVRQACRR